MKPRQYPVHPGGFFPVEDRSPRPDGYCSTLIYQKKTRAAEAARALIPIYSANLNYLSNIIRRVITSLSVTRR